MSEAERNLTLARFTLSLHWVQKSPVHRAFVLLLEKI